MITQNRNHNCHAPLTLNNHHNFVKRVPEHGFVVAADSSKRAALTSRTPPTAIMVTNWSAGICEAAARSSRDGMQPSQEAEDGGVVQEEALVPSYVTAKAITKNTHMQSKRKPPSHQHKSVAYMLCVGFNANDCTQCAAPTSNTHARLRTFRMKCPPTGCWDRIHHSFKHARWIHLKPLLDFSYMSSGIITNGWRQ